jgi:hypothetical protein
MRGKTEQRHSESEDAHGKPLKATAFQVFLVGLLLRSLVSLHPYSGQLLFVISDKH